MNTVFGPALGRGTTMEQLTALFGTYDIKESLKEA
jgi:hypothetical protein